MDSLHRRDSIAVPGVSVLDMILKSDRFGDARGEVDTEAPTKKRRLVSTKKMQCSDAFRQCYLCSSLGWYSSSCRKLRTRRL